MALISRLSRLFEADFHALLDRIEEPELQLKQAVREMQLALDQQRQRQKLLQHEGEGLSKAAAELVSTIDGYRNELDICLDAGKDDLARDLLRRKLADEKRLQAVSQQAETVTARLSSLGAEIDEQDQQLNSMKQKLELLVTADASIPGSGGLAAEAIRDEEIEIALLREKQRRTKS